MEFDRIIRERLQELHTAAPDSIGDLFQFELLECEPENNHFCFRCRTMPWMRNAAGTLHGGMSAAIADQAMGFIAYCLRRGEGMTPSIELHTNYVRPLIPEKNIAVSVDVVSVSSSLIFLTCRLCDEENPNKVCVMANGTYFCKHI